MKRSLILLKHFVVVKDFKRLSSSKWTIKAGILQGFLSNILFFEKAKES